MPQPLDLWITAQQLPGQPFLGRQAPAAVQRAEGGVAVQHGFMALQFLIELFGQQQGVAVELLLRAQQRVTGDRQGH
ncbi:hypothetical protein HQN78_16715 [Chromobacterium sp. Beijing]|nr:hypothetical protein HQN78_16715 [Chromobacterium sp. Beijing]